MTTTPTRTRSRFVEVALIVFGVYSVSVGLFMMLAPGTFFDTAISARRQPSSEVCTGQTVKNVFATRGRC